MNYVPRFDAACLIAGALAWGAPAVAHAQTSGSPSPEANPLPSQQESGPQAQPLQTMIVTGSLIPRIGDGPQPVTTLDRDFIQKQADQTVTDVIQRLPQAVGSFNPLTTTGIGSSPGGAAVGLRGLPFNATLVLVDGQRFPANPFPSVSTTGGPVTFVDLNSFPLAAVDRVEILKDGGGATYGSDAVAGVINLILRDNYNGADLTDYYGVSQRGDFEVNHVSLVAGINHKISDTSKFNLLASFDFYNQTPILSKDRPFSNTLNHQQWDPRYPAQSIFPSTAGYYLDPVSGTTYTLNPGTFGNATAADFKTDGFPNPNFSTKDQQIAPREQRFGSFFKINYEPTPWLRLHDEFIIQRTEEVSSSPNQGFGGNDALTIPASNPYNPFGVNLVPEGQVLPEFGPWRIDTVTRTFRNNADLVLQLPRDWFLELSFTYGESDGTEIVDNSLKRDAVQAALNGALSGYEGEYFNPFVDEARSGPNRGFYPAIATQQRQNNRTDLAVWTLKTGGTVWDLPSGSITLGAGLEYRSESLIQSNDLNNRQYNVLSGSFPGPQTNARRHLYSAFGELTIPVLGERWSVPGARNLDVVLSERYDQYSDFGSAAKPKVTVRYKPFSDLTLRASYAEGFIASSLGQLFGTPIPGLQTISDPNFPPGSPQHTYGVVAYTGGNPRLKPENSYSYFAGAVWSPASSDPERSWWRWAKGFTAYLDWYQINLRNLVGNVSAQNLVDLAGAFPGAVTRGANGQITQIFATFQNLGDERTDGLDFGASYVTEELPWGKLDVEVNATYIYSFRQRQFVGANPDRTPGYQLWDLEDSYGVPDFKLIASIFYSKRLFGADTLRTGFTVNYVDSEHDLTDNFKGSFPNASLDAPGYVHRIGSFTTVDWQVSYLLGTSETVHPATSASRYGQAGNSAGGEKESVPEPGGSHRGLRRWLQDTTLTFGINNLGDVKPPYSADWYQGYDTSNALPFGRYFYVQAEKKF
ncbi:MAG TPA: TonB-dependent receptor [Chthoniobacterales bacterium]